MSQPNWIPDEYFYIQMLLLKEFRKEQIFLGGEAISILKRFIRKAPTGLFRAMLKQLKFCGILDEVSKNSFRIGKVDKKNLIKVNNYYIIPKQEFLPF